MEKQKIIFIISIGVVVMIIAGVILYLVVPKSSSKTVAPESVYYDQASGESVAQNSPLTQSAETNGAPNQPTYLGFSKLIDYGLSTTQLTQLKTAISNYSQKQSKKFTEVSLVVDSLRQPDPAPGSATLGYEFNVKVNRSKDYFIRISFTDSSSCTVSLYETDKTTLLFTQ